MFSNEAYDVDYSRVVSRMGLCTIFACGFAPVHVTYRGAA